MAYGTTTSSAATRAEFQPPQYTAAGSKNCSTTTSNGRSLVGVEPLSHVSPTRQDPLQSVSCAQRTCERLEVIPNFTGRNAADVSQGSGSAATRAKSQPPQNCESGANGYSAPTYSYLSESSSSPNSFSGGNMMGLTLGIGGEPTIFPTINGMFIETNRGFYDGMFIETEQDFYKRRLNDDSKNLTDYREPGPAQPHQ